MASHVTDRGQNLAQSSHTESAYNSLERGGRGARDGTNTTTTTNTVEKDEEEKETPFFKTMSIYNPAPIPLSKVQIAETEARKLMEIERLERDKQLQPYEKIEYALVLGPGGVHVRINISISFSISPSLYA